MTNWKRLKQASHKDLLRLSGDALAFYENTDEILFAQPDGLYAFGMDEQSLIREDMTLEEVDSLFCELRHEAMIGIPQAFYTGGGIYIAAMYVDANIYYAIDNCEYDESICIYDHRGEDQDEEFPCQNPIDYIDAETMTDEQLEAFNLLREALRLEMRD